MRFVRTRKRRTPLITAHGQTISEPDLRALIGRILKPGRRRTPLTIRPRYDGLMSLWGKAVRLKYGTTCLRCGRQAPQWKIDAAHILSRGAHPKLKYVVENGIPLCFLCHRFYDENKDSSREWAQTVIGKARWNRLLVREKTAGKLDKAAVKMDLLQQIAELEGSGT